MSPAGFAAFAVTLADAARAVTLGAADRVAENKNEDGTYDPVTAADREAERVIRALIEQAFPDHGIAGEEFPCSKDIHPNGQGRYRLELPQIN